MRDVRGLWPSFRELRGRDGTCSCHGSCRGTPLQGGHFGAGGHSKLMRWRCLNGRLVEQTGRTGVGECTWWLQVLSYLMSGNLDP